MSNSRQLRIVFMGTPDFAVESLRRLVDGGYNVVGVVTMPDKPAGRGLMVRESAVKRYASEAGLHILQPEKLRDPAFLDQLAALEPDLGIVIAFRMLPEAVWSMPRLGTFNLHASLLPQYRGAAPINWALINGEDKTGVTTFLLDSEIDKGDILGCRETEITREDTAGTLHDRLMSMGGDLVVETVEMLANGKYAPVAQPRSNGDLKPAPKIFREDCLIRWDNEPGAIFDFVRGLSPYPAAWTYLTKRDNSPYCVVKSENEEGETVPGAASCPAVPAGEILQVKVFAVRPEPADHSDVFGTVDSDGRKYIRVACRGGWVYIEELQAAGKKRMKTEEFLRGFSLSGK